MVHSIQVPCTISFYRKRQKHSLSLGYDWHADCLAVLVLLRLVGVIPLSLSLSVMPSLGADPEPVVQPGQLDPSRTAVRHLTLDEAIALAEQNNPQLRVAAAQREGAAAGILTARAYPNPNVNTMFGPQYSRLSSTGRGAPGLLQHYSYSQPLELPSIRKSRINAAEKARASSEIAIEAARLGLRGAVKQAFYLVLRENAELDIATENLKAIEDLRRRIEVQVEVGEAARLELVRAEAEVASARTLVRSAQLQLVTAISVLRATIGAPATGTLEPQGTLDPPIQLPGQDELLKRVLDRHPALRQSRADIETAEARLRAEIQMKKPQPTAYAEWEQQPDLGFMRFGISLPVPLWNKREGPIAEAVAAVNQSRAVSDVRRLELTAALERALGQYEVATQQLNSYKDGMLREAAAALEAAEAAFRFGERGIIEVLDAQRVLRSVRSDYLSSQFDLQSALIELEQLRAIDPGVNP